MAKANELDEFSSDLQKGLDPAGPEFTSDLTLKDTSKNLATGIERGLAPRYGVSPIPGHSNVEQSSATLGKGLRASEATGTEANVFVERTKFLGIVPISMGSYDDLTSKGRMFVWLLGDKEDGVNDVLNAVANSQLTAGTPNLFKYQFDIGYGFTNNMWEQALATGTSNRSTKYASPLFRRMNAPRSSTSVTPDDFVREYLKISDLYYVSAAGFVVSGPQLPQHWYMGDKVANGTSATTATANFIKYTGGGPSGTDYSIGGISSSWNLGNWTKSQRVLEFYNLDDAQLIRGYFYDVNVDSSVFSSAFNQNASASNYTLAGNATTEIATDRTYTFDATDCLYVLMKDPQGFIDSSYKAVLVAGKKSFAFVMQDWERDFAGRNVQIVPLTNRKLKPNIQTTVDMALDPYEEDGVAKNTCFWSWPKFSSATALATEQALRTANDWDQMVSLGPANSGVLRANTNYEFTYSIFDKQLNVESNVGEPAKFRTAAADFVSISLHRDEIDTAKYLQYIPLFAKLTLPIRDVNYQVDDGTDIRMTIPVNNLEIRFYYRALGSYEWLPALFIDLAKLWFYPNHVVLWACEGTQVGLPGGQPGGFVDHSELPEDEYIQVVNYKDRAFWFTKSGLVFSTRNNLFEYPLRNRATLTGGECRGSTVHTYRGQSEQEARMVIWGDKEAFISKFTGIKAQMPVVVSPSTTATFDVDGSDFNIENWADSTAFSYRAAIVADGNLYYWGEKGVYVDDGVGNPRKISKQLEPDIFDYYDPSKIDEIHCVYDEHTHEIIWFYPPKSDNTITHGLVLNIDTMEFHPMEWDFKIDWAQRISTSNSGVTQDTNNLRTVIAARKDSTETLQRGYFMDRLNRSGDMRPETEMLVKTIAAGAQSNQRVITLDSGYDSTNFATIATGDYIAFNQFQQYTGEATGDDLVGKVVSKSAPNITIQIPDGATLPAVTISDSRKYAPIWHAGASGTGLNGIPWQLHSKYWMPAGVNYSGIWQWLYFFFRYQEFYRIDRNRFTLSYRSPQGGDFISDIIELVNNSDDNCQIFHALRTGHQNNQGQAIKLKLSGVHIGDKWVLQYLQLQGQAEQGDILRQFQG